MSEKIEPTPDNAHAVIHRPGKTELNDYEVDNNRFDYIGIRKDMAVRAMEVYFREMIPDFDDTVTKMAERGFQIDMNRPEVTDRLKDLYGQRLDQEVAKNSEGFDEGLDKLLEE